MTDQFKKIIIESDLHRAFINDSITQFIIDQGFNPYEGDMLFLPGNFEIKVDHPNVAYSLFIEQPVIVKKPI